MVFGFQKLKQILLKSKIMKYNEFKVVINCEE